MGKVVVAVALGILMTSSVGLTEVTTPRIRARAKRNGSVRVSCFGYRGIGSRDLTTVEFERGVDEGSFEPLVTIAHPRRYQSYLEVPGAGVYWYRTRVVSDTGTSAWSLPVVVTALPPPTPRPTHTARPKPTPHPTAVSDQDSVEPSGDPRLPAGHHECADGTIGTVLELINDERRDAGRADLAANAQLMWSARAHTIQMARSQTLTHDGWADTIAASGYRAGGYLAENVAVGFTTAAAVVEGWMSSTGHRSTILNAAVHDTGLGCVVDPNGTVWWTEDFGG